MAKEIVKSRIDTENHIVINLEGGQVYELSIDIMGGFEKALKHLSYKTWFTEECANDLRESYDRPRFNAFDSFERSTATLEFFEYVQTIKKRSGCYRFQTYIPEDDNYIDEYIGVSSKIGSRVLSSFTARVACIMTNPVFVSFYLTETVADAYVLELYLINKYKPFQNKQYKAKDDLTLEITNMPEPTDKIQCNVPDKDSWANKSEIPIEIKDMIDSLAKLKSK